MVPDSLTRRGVLAAAGSVGIAGLAGCSDVTDQSFTADAVVMPDDAQEELVLAETVREGDTIKRSGPAGVEVSITNQASLYRRGPARGTPTVLEKFTSMVNGTEGAGAAISLPAADAPDLDGSGNAAADIDMEFLEGTPTVSTDRVSLVIPEGARAADGTARHGKLMALVPGRAMGPDNTSVTYIGDGPGAFFPSEVFYPQRPPGFSPSVAAPSEPTPDVRVFVPGWQPLANRLGMDGLPEGAEFINAGPSLETANTVFAGPVDVMFPDEIFDSPFPNFDKGVRLPLGSQPFALAALATPAASVLGQSANPIVNMGTTELLQQPVTRRMLARTGVTDAEQINWARGPVQIGKDCLFTPDRERPYSLLDTGTELEGVGGIVNGENGPWGVILIVGRVTTDGDHAIAASVFSRPVGTVDGGMGLLDEGEFVAMPDSGFLEFTTEAMGRLVDLPPIQLG